MNKKFFVVGLVVVLLFAGCSVANSPKAALQSFYKAVEKNDTKAMAKVATPETVQLVTMFGSKLQGMMDSYGKVKTVTEEIDGDTAVVTVTFENGEETNIDMVKVDGKWKVALSMGK